MEDAEDPKVHINLKRFAHDDDDQLVVPQRHAPFVASSVMDRSCRKKQNKSNLIRVVGPRGHMALTYLAYTIIPAGSPTVEPELVRTMGSVCPWTSSGLGGAMGWAGGGTGFLLSHAAMDQI